MTSVVGCLASGGGGLPDMSGGTSFTASVTPAPMLMTLTTSECQFTSNRAVGATNSRTLPSYSSARPSPGAGGAIYIGTLVTATLSAGTLLQNYADAQVRTLHVTIATLDMATLHVTIATLDMATSLPCT